VRGEPLDTALRRLQAQYGFSRPFLILDTQGFDVRFVRAGASVIGEFVGLRSEPAIARLYADFVEFSASADLLRVFWVFSEQACSNQRGSVSSDIRSRLHYGASWPSGALTSLWYGWRRNELS
jgi:hypothetical protein